MNSYALTKAAEADLRQIARHTLRQWGADQVKTYMSALDRAFENLAVYPDAGRSAGNLREGYFRFESQRHAVFYRKTANGILIVRVLHQKMEPTRDIKASNG